MLRLSIRLRLTLWYSAVLLLGLLLFAYGMWLALQQHLVSGVDGRLAQTAEGLGILLTSEETSADLDHLQEEIAEYLKEVPTRSLIQLRMDSGQEVFSSANPPFLSPDRASNNPVFRTLYRDRNPFRILMERVDSKSRSFDLLVASPLDEVQVALRDFRRLLLMMIPGVLAAACLGGWWISRRALAPVDEITRVARSITVQNLSKRLNVPQTGDELQRMSETWNEVLARLESAVERTRRFTADASHELRTPLSLIRATAELALRRQRDPQEYREALSQIESEAKRMTTLTDDLLSLAAADANSLEMPLVPSDVNRIVAEVVEENRALAESRGIQLRADLLSTPASAPAHEPGMRRLLRILVDNALKFTPSGGSVEVSTSGSPKEITVSVQDTGCGIAAAALPHIFERFYRAESSQGESTGAGLGLSIAQMIARAHGSMVRVESAPGSGSRFWFTLKN
jgi:two-component system heavy metal sensor histidine kinase CusS